MTGPVFTEDSWVEVRYPLTPGQEADFKVIRMNEEERKIGLSLKAMADSAEHDRLEDYRRRATAAGSGLEGLLPRKTESATE